MKWYFFNRLTRQSLMRDGMFAHLSFLLRPKDLIGSMMPEMYFD